MKDRYLEVTFRKGKLVAAYLHLPRQHNVRSARTELVGTHLLADYDLQGSLIGIELTVPGQVTLEQINKILDQAGIDHIGPEELAPLQAP